MPLAICDDRHIVKVTDLPEEIRKAYLHGLPISQEYGAHKARPSWDELFMNLAQEIATRSTCLRLACGAVLTIENRVVGAGYNGSLPGHPHCLAVGCLVEDGHCIRTNHAERNAIYHAARLGVCTDGATLYTTSYPCWPCFQGIVAAGIRRVVYTNDYNPSPLVAIAAEISTVRLSKLS